MKYIFFLMLCCNLLYASLPKVPQRPWGDVNYSSSSLHARTFQTQHIAVAVFVLELKTANILNKDTKYLVDKQTNSIWISADKNTLITVQQWLKAVDKSPRQISIRARIVYIDDNQLQHLGLSLQQSASGEHDVSDGLRFPILHLRASTVLDAEIDLLKQKGEAKIVASPELLTTNNQEASISSGDEIPYQETTASGATSATFKKAVMRLAVTPSVLTKNYLSLNIQLNQDQVSKSLVNGVPAIKTRELKTTVRLYNNQTVVLGGIKQTRVEHSRRGIPVLSDIPILGYLFGRRASEQQRQSLWIILTPHILK